MIPCNVSPTPVAKAFKVNWKKELTTPMGIAAGFAATAACGIVRVGAAEVVVFEFDVADWVMFLPGDVEIEGSEVAGLMIGMLFAESGAEESRIIPVLGSLTPKAFVFNDPAERTSLAALAAGVTEVAGVAGLNSTRFWPTEVVLKLRRYPSAIKFGFVPDRTSMRTRAKAIKDVTKGNRAEGRNLIDDILASQK